MTPLSAEEVDPPQSFPKLRRELVRRFAVVMKEITGKGPEHSRLFVNQNLVTVFAQGTLTPGEETLLRSNREDAVKEVQGHLQVMIQNRFAGQIEALTGGEIVCSLSDHGIDPDLAVYCFVLASDLVEPRT